MTGQYLFAVLIVKERVVFFVHRKNESVFAHSHAAQHNRDIRQGRHLYIEYGGISPQHNVIRDVIICTRCRIEIVRAVLILDCHRCYIPVAVFGSFKDIVDVILSHVSSRGRIHSVERCLRRQHYLAFRRHQE